MAPAALLRSSHSGVPLLRSHPFPTPPENPLCQPPTSGRSEVGGPPPTPLTGVGKKREEGKVSGGDGEAVAGDRGAAGGGQELSETLPAGRGGAHPGTGPCPRGRAAPRVLCAWAARTSPARIPLPRRPRLRWPPAVRTPTAAAAVAAETGASGPPAWRPRACCREEPRGAIEPAPGVVAPAPGAHKKISMYMLLTSNAQSASVCGSYLRQLTTPPRALHPHLANGPLPWTTLSPRPATLQPDTLPEHPCDPGTPC